MKFHQAKALLFVPDSSGETEALARTTHLGIGAHQDDLEFMAYHGIATCYEQADRWFTGVTCTNGAGSSRTGPFAEFTDEQMQEVRREEQNEAASLGKYAAQFQLDFPSSAMKDPSNGEPQAELEQIITATRPEVIYTHNPADKHPTHLAVTAAVIMALRALPAEYHPKQFLGCEGWRDLDWLSDAEKVPLDVSAKPELAAKLASLFASQIAGGKRYDLAVEGRRRANATFFDSHSVDAVSHLAFAIDLSPLLTDPTSDPVDFTLGHIDRFRASVTEAFSPFFAK
jgi:LmbE family N-acetylglucosaminyl deacetylase